MKLTNAWYGLICNCSECKKPSTLQTAEFSADGELRFMVYCFDCHVTTYALVFATALAEMARRRDIQKCLNSLTTPNTPVQPPIKKEVKPNQKDKDFLHDLGIGDCDEA